MLVQSHIRLSFHRTTFFGKHMFSSHAYVRVGAYLFYHTVLCCIVQWCKGILYVAFQGERSFVQNTQVQLESLSTEERGCYIAPCEWINKSKTKKIDFIPRLASEFYQPHSLATHSCCTTCMTRTTTSVSTAQLLIFLIKPFSCFRSTTKHSCICLFMQTRCK